MVDPKFYSVSIAAGGELKREFIQSVVVAAQLRQLVSLFKGSSIDFATLDLASFLDAFSESDLISRFIAVILREKGQSLKEKNIEELTDFFDENASLELIIEIVKDFFLLNGILNLLQNNPIEQITEALVKTQIPDKTGKKSV